MMRSNDTDDYQTLLDQKGIAGRGNRELWMRELVSTNLVLEQKGYSHPFSEKMISSVSSLDELKWTRSFLEAFGDEYQDPARVEAYMQESIDASPYTLGAWIKAAMIFHKTTRVRLEQTKASRVFAYLACSSEFAKSNPINLSFEDVVSEMVQEYGFDNRDDE